MTAKRPPDCTEIQNWLFKYLKTGFDPLDFPLYLIKEWAEEEGLEDVAEQDNVYFDELSDEHQQRYSAWLRDEIPRLMQQDPRELPAYVTMKAEEKLPAGTWLAHFTRERGGFYAFDRGTTIEGMHLSTWKKNKTKARCDKNLSTDIGIGEVVFGFAFRAEGIGDRKTHEARRMYGGNLVLFQCDCAVEAYHEGDDQYQVVFPICAEYNVVPFYGENDGQFIGQTEGGEDIEFDGVADALHYVQHAERPAGLGGASGWPRLRRLVRK